MTSTTITADSPRLDAWNARSVAPADLGVVLISGAGALAVIIIALGGVAAVDEFTDLAVAGPIQAAIVPLALATAIVLLRLLLRRRSWRWRDLGFRRLGTRGWHLLWQIPVGVTVSLVVMVLGADLLLGLEPVDEPASTNASLGAGSGVGWILLGLLGALVAGPLLEEIVFRRLVMGWLEQVMRRWWSRRWAVAASTLLSSALFALMHLVVPVMLWTFLLGLCCAVVTRWHGSLWAGFLFHLANNVLASTAVIAAVFTS